jgi:hypothetical protein
VSDYPFFLSTSNLYDLEAIRADVAKAIDLFGWGEGNHICLVHPSSTDQDPHRDAASRRNWPQVFPEGMRMSWFEHFNEWMTGSYLHGLYSILKDKGSLLARMRIARIPPFRNYSFHNDEEVRLHMAVHTHPHCFFIVSKQGRDDKNMPVYPEPTFVQDDLRVFHVPADGRVYLLDTNHTHTALNASSIERIHLVIETVSPLNDRLFKHV